MEEIVSYLNFINKGNSESANAVTSYLNDYRLTKISKEYIEFQYRSFDVGFNLFYLISDIYYRENFHSDILKSFLDKNEKHNEGSKFLYEFIRYINTANTKAIYLIPSDYSNATVHRELGRIDILIKDSVSKKAIIIENKINRAGDQYRQIPRYVAILKEQGYKVDAVIYLLLNYHLSPDTFGWTELEKNEIMPILIPIAAYNESPTDLVNGWLHKCERLTTNIDALFIFRQYQKLIQQLGERAMNKEVMQKFYDNLLQADNYKTAISIRDMLDDLQTYRIDHIVDTYLANYHPFESVRNWQNRAAVFDKFQYMGNAISVDIYVEGDVYKFQLFFRGPVVGNLTLEQILEKMEINDFAQVNERMQKIFKFPEQEIELYNYINFFKVKLAEISLLEKAQICEI